MIALFCSMALSGAWGQDSWKKSIRLPEGKNLFSNPTLQPHATRKGSIDSWGNNGGKRLKISWTDTTDGKILKVKSSAKGYHLGIARTYKLKPNTEYLYYMVCRGKLEDASSRLIMLYCDGKLPNWKKSVIAGAKCSMKKSFSWQLFQRTLRTPDANVSINTSFYPILFYGVDDVDIAYVGLIEKGPARKALAPLDPKFKNLLHNPTFKNGPGNLPYNWNLEFSSGHRNIVCKNGVVTLKKIVPEKRAFKTAPGDSVVLRQGEFILNPGKKYRISAWIKTENLNAPRSGIIVYNYAWTHAVGIEGLPENTNGWKKFEKDIVLPKSKWNAYTFAVYTVGTKGGLLHVKDVGLYPVDDAAAANITKATPHGTLYRITPVDPLLSEMDADSGKMTFSFNYILPGKESDFLCSVSVKGKGSSSYGKAKTFPLKNGKIAAVMGKLPAGEGSMLVELKNRKTGKLLAREEYEIVVKKPVTLKKKAVRLNQLTQRLLNGKASGKGEKHLFSNPRRGWVWIRLDSAAKDAVVKLNNVPVKGHFVANGWETTRHLEKGNHTLTLEKVAGGTAFRVHSIPEVFAYSYPWAPGKVKYETFRKDFSEKYFFPTITTVNHGYGTRDEVRERYVSYGKKWFSLGLHLHKLNYYEDPVKMAKRLRITRKFMHGIAFDEIFINSTTDKWIYTQALRNRVKSPWPVYTWSSGVKFIVNGLNTDYFSATANNARGTGKYLFECYARTQPDEKAADAYLEDYLNETMRRASAMMPRAPEYSLIILGGYTMAGGYCTDTFAGPDVKSFWDKFFFRLANDKEFKDLYGVGLYCYNRGHEENIRWWAALIRHYCFEGRTESLAGKYGYKYMPGHLRNGDFTEKLAHWKAVPAEKGSLYAGSKERFGLNFQGRRGYPYTTGNTYCVFKRSAKKENTLSTRLTGLEKGKFYSVRYLTVDHADVKAKKPSDKTLGLFVRLNGAKDMTASSGAGRYTNGSGISIQRYVNNHTVVFRADAPEVTLTFSDWKDSKTPGGPAGQEILLNKVSVTPYFREK